jgi:hypothetical protein
MEKEKFFKQLEGNKYSIAFYQAMNQIWENINKLPPEQREQYLEEIRQEAAAELERRGVK